VIAHLGMYGGQTENLALWFLIRRALGYGPDALTDSEDPWPIWQSPDLLLSQTCGYPYRAKLHGTVILVGTPDYGLDTCRPGYYRSLIVARKSESRCRLKAFDGATFAYNDALSQSGWAGPALMMEEQGITPRALVKTGSHAGSITAVAKETADFASIDAVTWSLAQQTDMEIMEHVHVIDQTPETPGLPFITAPGRDIGALRGAIETAIAQMPGNLRRHLPLRGLVTLPAEDYLAVKTPAPPKM